jgi:PAS domain S-box-containing protein
MSISDQNDAQPTASKRSRLAVLASTGASHALAAGLLDTAPLPRATVKVTSTRNETIEVVDRFSDELRLLAIDTQFPDFLTIARHAAERSPLSEVILLCPEAEIPALRNRLGLASRLGTHWSIVALESNHAPRALRSAFQRADQRRATRTTLDRFNARITAPAPSVDAGQMRELVISDRFLSSILESNFDAVIIVDTGGRITKLNRAAEALFERSSQEMISHPVIDLARGRWREDVQPLLALQREGTSIQTEIGDAGSTKHIEISATPVFDRGHNLMATSLIVRDVTSRVQSEATLRTTEKLVAVGRLASSIAHEINNPLESLTNILYITRQQATDPEMIHWLELADQELRRVSIITNQTLLFHKQSTFPSDFEISELTRGVLTMFQGRISKSDVEVVERSRDKCSIRALNGEIRQVVTNLVANAIDAMPTGGRLYVRSQGSFDWKTMRRGIKLVIADTGHGMSPSTLNRLFEAFYTTKGENGTGVGLWLSRDIVLRHEGSLRVRSSQSKNHQGTVFVMFLPQSGG